ncbi:DUF4145 domain-containing protein [Brevundimonas sp. BAL450]|uniref:DUF4145 domain-containing protein n=1 Tax=Brevundimonas TaxID=41275 RepID=UPI0009DCD88B|nr:MULTISPECIES: DUF4145 domain-containing protein [Brevundimonas]MBG7615627.1 DUF4145 domain-containing protein [Brevundimonas sp. BAL450]
MISHRLSPDAEGLPAYGVSLRCPFCRHVGVFPGFSKVNDVKWLTSEYQSGVPGGGKIGVDWSAGVRRCPNTDCSSLVFVIIKRKTLYASFPSETIDFDSSELPESILRSLEEAIKCHSNGAYRASTLMVRRLLEELCADRGAKGSDLKKRLLALSQTIVLPQELLEAADELRLLGNDAAHIEARIYDDIGQSEAELAIELAKELLKAVYQYASLVSRLRALKRP